MKIIVTAQGNDLNAPVSPTFARCPYFLVVDTETNAVVPVVNKSMREPKGAGIAAAQFVLSQKVDAVVTNKMGPKAFRVLQVAGVPVYSVTPMTVGGAVNEFNAGKLLPIKVPSI